MHELSVFLSDFYFYIPKCTVVFFILFLLLLLFYILKFYLFGTSSLFSLDISNLYFKTFSQDYCIRK